MARVLVVDDSRFTRKHVVNMLTADHDVTEAGDGCEALSLIEANEFDCVFSDLLMPNLDGYGLLRALQDQGCPIPVVMITADVQSHARTDCLALGAFRFLNKPAQREDVLQALSDALTTAAGEAATGEAA